MTTSPDGDHVQVTHRLAEIQTRYGSGHLVSRSMRRATPLILEAVGHVHARTASSSLGCGGCLQLTSDVDVRPAGPVRLAWLGLQGPRSWPSRAFGPYRWRRGRSGSRAEVAGRASVVSLACGRGGLGARDGTVLTAGRLPGACGRTAENRERGYDTEGQLRRGRQEGPHLA
jgi:hypothetical protein